jgi:hypothetical protein
MTQLPAYPTAIPSGDKPLEFGDISIRSIITSYWNDSLVDSPLKSRPLPAASVAHPVLAIAAAGS